MEDWSTLRPGSRGIPAGWEGAPWGNPSYDLTVVEESPTRVLHLRSRGDSSTITKAVKVDLRRAPVLEWRWKALTLPTAGDARRKAADDQALQIYLTWERPPRLLSSRIIGYVWDSTAPAGTVLPSQKSELVTYIVLRSGPRDLGRWLTEVRDVYQDYRRIYQEEPDEVDLVSIAIDSDDTRSAAEGFVGTIRFRPR